MKHRVEAGALHVVARRRRSPDHAAAALDGVGVVHADGRGERRAAAPVAQRPDARALPDALRAPGHWPAPGEQRRVVAAATTVVALLCNALAGYAFAKLPFPGRDGIVPPAARRAGHPGAGRRCCRSSSCVRWLGLVNTWLGVMVPGLASIFGIFLVRQYALGFPTASSTRPASTARASCGIFGRVVLPLMPPDPRHARPRSRSWARGTTSSGRSSCWPTTAATRCRVALANLVGEHVQDTELMMAGAVLTVAPVVLLFLVLQR